MRRYRAIPEYYDAEHACHAMLEHDVPFFLRHARSGQSILELGAGTGRAAIPLAQAGHRVVGVDCDERMLRIARRKRETAGLSERELKLVRADMLRLELRERFDWVCLFFNTFLAFTSLEEQDSLLQVVARHLGPRGRLWLDVFQPDPVLLARQVSRDLEPVLFYVPGLNRSVMKTTEIRQDAARQVQHVVFHYAYFDAHGRQRRRHCAFDIAFLFPRELKLLLERNGLRVRRMYGDHDGSRLGPDSPRIIVLGELS